MDIECMCKCECALCLTIFRGIIFDGDIHHALKFHLFSFRPVSTSQSEEAEFNDRPAIMSVLLDDIVRHS